MTQPQPHTNLPGGRVLVSFTCCEGRNDYLDVVLAKDPKTDEHVCWMYNSQTGGYFWGQYGDDARPSYSARVRRYTAAL